MLQFAIALLFAFAGIASLAVISQTLRRAWIAAGELRAAIARCDEIQPLTVRTVSFERRPTPPVLRVIPGSKAGRTASARCALPVAA